MRVDIVYNPYLVKTDISINGKTVEDSKSPLTYIKEKRLQEWIEPKGSWQGFFQTLRSNLGDRSVEINFHGTNGDFDDLKYASNKYGMCFENISLVHINKDRAAEIDPYKKMKELGRLYEKLQNGPFEEFKQGDIRKNFEEAVKSDFRIVVVAPMSSGKSTLINSMIGRDLLPAVNQATTAVITEIKDNDAFEDFTVAAIDKYNNTIVDNEKATKKLISDLNYKKDPNDPKNKECLVRVMKLEGPIPNLPSDVLNTVFVDTPGGNNSQNIEHELLMNEAINDENKSLILYVFNGQQLTTNDGDRILSKIAHAMKSSEYGKQSRDRFLFVANRMDDIDTDQETYEEVINNSILPMLVKQGITDPNLFLVSAQTAKLIRMENNGEELSEKEEEDIDTLIKRFNRYKKRALTKYASINSTMKQHINDEAINAVEIAKNTDSKSEERIYKMKAAELNSGIPALEYAIKEYLEKYAIAIKIKTVHDTFMKKVNERRMIDACEQEWAESADKFEEMKEIVKVKKEKCANNKKLLEFRDKVSQISFDEKGVREEQRRINLSISKLGSSIPKKIKYEEAEFYLKTFSNDLERIGKDAKIFMENAFEKGIKLTCINIIEEYQEYINELDSGGFFDIGNFNIKQTSDFASFDIKKSSEILSDPNYVKTERVQHGNRAVKKKGFFAGIARFFGCGGYEDIPNYVDEKYMDFESFMNDHVTSISHELDKEIKDEINDTKKKVEEMKEYTLKKLVGLDNYVSQLLKEIEEKLNNQKELQQKVQKNAEKTEWLKDFINEVDDLLKI